MCLPRHQVSPTLPEMPLPGGRRLSGTAPAFDEIASIVPEAVKSDEDGNCRSRLSILREYERRF